MSDPIPFECSEFKYLATVDDESGEVTVQSAPFQSWEADLVKNLQAARKKIRESRK